MSESMRVIAGVVLSVEGALARPHLVQHAAEREDVGARVELFALHLAGGPPRILSNRQPGAFHGAWNDKGDILFNQRTVPPGVLRRVSSSGEPLTPATQFDPKNAETDGHREGNAGTGAREATLELATMGTFERKTRGLRPCAGR